MMVRMALLAWQVDAIHGSLSLVTPRLIDPRDGAASAASSASLMRITPPLTISTPSRAFDSPLAPTIGNSR